MAGPRLTDDQRRILTMLRAHPGSSARELADGFERQRRGFGGYYTIDHVAASLLRMSRRGLVLMDHSRPRRWQVTSTGAAALGRGLTRPQ